MKNIILCLFFIISYLKLEAQCTSQRTTNPTFSPITGWTKTANVNPASPGISFVVDNSTDYIYQDLTNVNPNGQSPVINMCVGTRDAVPLGAGNISGWARLELWYAGTLYVTMTNAAGPANDLGTPGTITYHAGATGNTSSLIKNNQAEPNNICKNNMAVTLPSTVPNNGRLEFKYFTQLNNPPHNGITQADDDFYVRSITVTATQPTPNKPTVSPNVSICMGSSTTLTATPPYPYNPLPAGAYIEWYGYGLGVIGTGSSIEVSPTIYQAYGARVILSSGCASDLSDWVYVTPVNPPATPTVSTTAATCSANGTATISNYNAYYTYIFSPSGPSVGFGGAISGMATGTNYTVRASFNGCLSSSSTSFSIGAMLPTPTAPVISGSYDLCAGGVSTLTSSSATGNQWYKDGILIPGATNQNYTASAPGVYTAKIISGGCESTSSAGITVIDCPSAIGCDNIMYLSSGNTTQLYEFDTSNSPITYNTVGANAGITYNAIGINPIDGQMYGMVYSGPLRYHVIIIYRDGTYTDLGTVTNLPAGANQYYNAGEIDEYGNYYVKEAYNDVLQKIDLNTLPLTATAIPLNKGSLNTGINDLAYSTDTGLLYAVNSNGRLLSFDPATGDVTGIGNAVGGTGQSWGAMFGADNGGLYGARNGGSLYQINKLTGDRLLIASSPSSQDNDGAHCVTSPITFEADLSVAKTNNANVYIAGMSTTYTIVVTNNGSFGVMNAHVSDPLPTGIPAGNVSYTAVASSGSITNVSGTQTGAINDYVSLPSGGTVTYTVTVDIPASFTGDLVNTVTVTPSADSEDPDLSNNTATDTDTQHILECDITDLVEKITDGVFPTTSGENNDTNTISGWIVGGTAGGNRIRINPKGIKFWKDSGTTTTLSQSLIGVKSGSVITLKDAYWTRTFQNNATAHSVLEISYAGTVYATIDIANTYPTITGNNGAVVTPNTMPASSGGTYTDSPVQDISIYLPAIIPSTGDLVLTFAAGSSSTEARDFGLSAISLRSCRIIDVCTKPGDFSTGGIPTKVGITVQDKLQSWPESVPNGFITLESKTKGFVITRVQNSGVIPVAEAKEGMLIYDIDADCVKLYNGSVWKCIERSCNE